MRRDDIECDVNAAYVRCKRSFSCYIGTARRCPSHAADVLSTKVDVRCDKLTF